MKRVFLSCMLIFSGLNVCSQDVLVFEKGEKFGLKSAGNNKIIVKADYDYIYPLSDFHLLIEKNRKIGVISKSGKVLFPPLYDDVQRFGDDNFLVLSNNRWGVIDRFGKTVVPVEYSGVERLDDYLYIIHSRNKKGLANRFGKMVLQPGYDEIIPLSDNHFIVRNGNSVGLIDDLGNAIIIPGKYNYFEKLSPFNLYKVRFGSKWGIVDASGITIADPVLDEVSYSSAKNYITVKKDGKFGFIINKQYLPARYDRILFTQDEFGIIAVKEGRLTGFVTTGGIVINPIYDNISRFSPRGYAFVEKRGKLRFVDVTGKERSLQDVAGNGG
ncbi:MAG: WG repeat-containing protein [Prevotella sp.]|nr:WG repeat-containing protein [Prevotella sp.]